MLDHTGEVVQIADTFAGKVVAHDLSGILMAAACRDAEAAIAGDVSDAMTSYFKTCMAVKSSPSS